MALEVKAMKSLLVLASIIAFATSAGAQTDTTATPASTASAPSGTVKRAVFCTGVTEREPVDEVATLAAPAAQVYFFTEIIGMAGKTVTHKWSLDGSAMGEVPISIGADRWRCYSVKTLAPTMTGTWTVTVVDGEGMTLVEKTVTYTAAP
jgi:hypothetical protein